MKRKAEKQASRKNGKGILKKRVKTELSTEDVHKRFRDGLFAKDVLSKSTKEYAASEPYKHCVITSLINDELLRSVREEIQENVEFAPKETDIYKIHQSGDLANLDGLDDGALEKLPSVLRLRDAMYSAEFREYLSTITGSGKLSGRKTDMAINVYTPGCHLLCHDDVIGSRRISYILYLVNPDIPWKEEWGGALRLFPTETFKDKDGEETIVPGPDTSKSIPPAWNQLSFFAVQPGQSFHDVEEVYHAETDEELEKNGGRVRMAISGWFHIPQIGEDGYVKGEEEKWGKNSSLMQLQGNPALYDCPRPQPVEIAETLEEEEEGLSIPDLDFLLKYMAPTYLTPDTLEDIQDQFTELSSVTLDGLLHPKFAAKVKEYIEEQEYQALPASSSEIEKGPWKVAKPPHKHRFLYLQASKKDENPIKELTEVFLASPQFRKWLALATKCDITNYDILARRFRRGLDYSLAKSHEGESQLEISLGLTPTPGWGGNDGDDEEEAEAEAEAEAGDDEKKSESKDSDEPSKKEEAKVGDEEKKSDSNGSKGPTENEESEAGDDEKSDSEDSDASTEKEELPEWKPEDNDVGGYEAYMAGDEENDEDAAVYKATAEDEDDNVLFTMPASWNNMSIVLRDSGVLKFVKYVSKSAKGDRWDVNGAFGVKIIDESDEEDGADGTVALYDSEEEVFNGFSDSNDSDSE